MIHKIPGFEYEHHDIIDRNSDNIGFKMADVSFGFPFALIAGLQPTNPAAWVAKCAAVVILFPLWMATLGWVLLSTGILLGAVLRSWAGMRDRQASR